MALSNLILSILGLALGGAALWVAIVHFRKARTAAEAAQAASEAALEQVANIGSVVDLGRLKSRANEVIVLIRNDNYGAAEINCLCAKKASCVGAPACIARLNARIAQMERFCKGFGGDVYKHGAKKCP